MGCEVSIGAPMRAELEAVYDRYLALSAWSHGESGLGGKLLFSGELDIDGCRLVRAANIAGAASLSATGDPDRQRSAIREGAIDFLVTSLDEALRILKNEIRKKNPVAVGIAGEPARVVAEMRERGVLPDLLRSGPDFDVADFVLQGAQRIDAASPAPHARLMIISCPPADFENRVLALLAESDPAARRWVRLAPRYLGRAARRVRSVPAIAAVMEEPWIRQAEAG